MPWKLRRHAKRQFISYYESLTNPLTRVARYVLIDKQYQMKHSALLDDYYSAESIKEWQAIIGDELHYHFGFFSTPDMDLEAALEKAIENFYDYIPRGSSVLDAGCGWGGPARMLSNERECKVLGVTISQSQYEHCRNTGLNVERADLEAIRLEQKFDIVVMFESLEHIKDKLNLLIKWRDIGQRLIIRTNCTAFDTAVNRPEFSGTMYLQTPDNLRRYLEQAGWNVIFMENRRSESRQTLLHWKRRLQAEYQEGTPPGHLGDLLKLSNHALLHWQQWARSHPLMDIVAE